MPPSTVSSVKHYQLILNFAPEKQNASLNQTPQRNPQCQERNEVKLLERFKNSIVSPKLRTELLLISPFLENLGSHSKGNVGFQEMSKERIKYLGFCLSFEDSPMFAILILKRPAMDMKLIANKGIVSMFNC